METRDIRLEVKIWGSILDCQIFLENNQEVGFWAYNSSKKIYFKELKMYEIDGGILDVKILCKGKNGAKATLLIKIDGQLDETIICEIEHGASTKEKSINILS